LALAILIWKRPNLLVLDEPTNHLDLEMRQALTMAMQGFEGAVVLVSHDRYLLRNTVEQFWRVGDGKAEPFEGDLDAYQTSLQLGGSSPTSRNTQEPRVDRKAERQLAAQRRQQLKPLKDALNKAEKTLEKVQLRLAQLEEALADTALYEAAQKDKLQSLLREQGLLKQQEEELESQWYELTDQLDAALMSS